MSAAQPPPLAAHDGPCTGRIEHGGLVGDKNHVRRQLTGGEVSNLKMQVRRFSFERTRVSSLRRSRKPVIPPRRAVRPSPRTRAGRRRREGGAGASHNGGSAYLREGTSLGRPGDQAAVHRSIVPRVTPDAGPVTAKVVANATRAASSPRGGSTLPPEGGNPRAGPPAQSHPRALRCGARRAGG